MSEEYLVVRVEDSIYQSVFPSDLAHHSELHSSIDDAVAHLLHHGGPLREIRVVLQDAE